MHTIIEKIRTMFFQGLAKNVLRGHNDVHGGDVGAGDDGQCYQMARLLI